MVKKCDQALSDHLSYLDKYKQCSERLATAQQTYEITRSNTSGTRQELSLHIETLQDLLNQQASMIVLVNNTVEAGERLYTSTGEEGREIIRHQLLELQQALETLYDGVTLSEREIQAKISKWSGFDECSEIFDTWLSNLESELKPQIELKSTLDEKRAQLQSYRTLFHDAQTHQQDLFDLRDKVDCLPDRPEKIEKILINLSKRHESVLKRASEFVERYVVCKKVYFSIYDHIILIFRYISRYEGIVSDHQQYSKAVLDAHEWLDATLNTVNMWGDTEVERVSLHTNLDRLQNLLQSLPEEEPRVRQIRSLGDKVIPGTLESGQVNIRSQMDSSQQEWEGLVSTVKSTIDCLRSKLQHWNEYETSKELCLAWIRDTDTKLHAVDLRSTLDEKKEQLEMLRSLQGEVRAKELEIDVVAERAHQLHKHSLRGSQVSEIGIKYQQISSKVKELNNRWQQYVTGHQEFNSQLNDISQWLDEIRNKLAYCSNFSGLSQKDLETKMETIQDLLLYKESGFAKVYFNLITYF